MDFNEINEFEKNYIDNLEKIENEMSGRKKQLELNGKKEKIFYQHEIKGKKY